MGSFKINRLFRPGPNRDLNACVGENGGPYDFFDYALGYLKAASAMVGAVERMELPADIAVYPMVYCYRHGIELCLKHLGRILPPLDGEKSRVLATHKLTDNWEYVKQYLARRRAFKPETTIPIIDQIIQDILDFDPKGEVFRFPEDRKGGVHLHEAKIINLDVLKEYVDQTTELFSSWAWSAESR
jgi:hypothetical protein